MRVALYARVSSDKQDTDLSISAQLKELEEYSRLHNHSIVGKYIDEAESGRSADRPAFKQMAAAVRQKLSPFDTILVWKLNRFARNREDSIIYKALFKRHGVRVISITEPFEDTPTGRLLESIVEAMDEFYSANLAQDVVRGMKENASRGYRNGGRTPYGYVLTRVQDGTRSRSTLTPDLVTATIVQRIFRECSNGKGFRLIVRSLNAEGVPSPRAGIWGISSIEKIVHNEAYTGTLVWGTRKQKTRPDNDHIGLQRAEKAWPTIIDISTFRQTQAMLAARHPGLVHPRQVDSPYLLSGIARCGLCGAAVIGHGSQTYKYYSCGQSRRKGTEICPASSVRKERLETAIIDRIRDYVLSDENTAELVRLTNEELGRMTMEQNAKLGLVKRQIADIDSRLANLYDAIETGQYKDTELASRIRTLSERREELQRKQATSEDEPLAGFGIADPQVVRSYASELSSLLRSSSVSEQRAFLKSFVNKVEIRGSEVSVAYTVPLPPSGETENGGEVLPSVHHGKGRRGARGVRLVNQKAGQVDL